LKKITENIIRTAEGFAILWTEDKYLQSKKGKETLKKYQQSYDGKEARKKWGKNKEGFWRLYGSCGVFSLIVSSFSIISDIGRCISLALSTIQKGIWQKAYIHHFHYVW